MLSHGLRWIKVSWGPGPEQGGIPPPPSTCVPLLFHSSACGPAHSPAPFCPIPGPRPCSTHGPAQNCPHTAAPQPIRYFLPPPHTHTVTPRPEKLCPTPWPWGAAGSESPPALRQRQVARVLPSWGCWGGPSAKASPAPTPTSAGQSAGASPVLLSQRPGLWGPPVWGELRVGVSAPPPTSTDAGSIPATGTDPTQPGAAPAPTRLDSPEPGSRPLTWAIIAGMSVAAAGLLLLLFLVAFVCFRKIRATVPPQRSRISAPAEGFLYKEPSAPGLSGTWGARGANLWIRKRSRTETKQHQPYGGIKGAGSARPPLHLHRQRERDADPVMSRERVPSAPPSWPRHEMLPTPGPCSLRTYRSACRDTTDPHPPAPGCSDIGWLPVASVSLNFCLKSPPKSASPHK
ncbi:proline-rich receptor-like protein kinase PERK2 isoform X2 [Mauremys mutica]|uniref:proline-rich receptor-like protein kinase PERK2 isoform X2 n=1 Tax=Mauremys mutica TaxID=74926 RepID=UPI001D16DCDC|nr:proline-rich receptor-like protein kinase PERK2 isoform X2 [Mauremys mutica]